jgi:hypothetical protein
MPNQPDKIITVEECDTNTNRAVRNVKILRGLADCHEQLIHEKAVAEVWRSIKHHIEKGVVLTMDSQGAIHTQK